MSSNQPNHTPAYAVEGEFNWNDLPEEVQVKALGVGIQMLATRGLSPISTEELSGALGPDELRLIATQVELTEDQLQTVAEAISTERITNGSTAFREDVSSMTTSQTLEVLYRSLMLTGAIIGIAGAVLVFLMLGSIPLALVIGMAVVFFLYSYKLGLEGIYATK